jgi:hypothetical protein
MGGWYQWCSIQSSVVSVLGSHRTSEIEFALLEWADVGERGLDEIRCETHFDDFADPSNGSLLSNKLIY